MTIGLRDQLGHTRTFHQDGSRIRIANPSGTDDGEARIVDLKTTEHVIVYDDAKAYYDYNKALAKLRAAVDELRKTQPPERKKPVPAISFRSLGEERRLNGLACAMYERAVDGKADAQLCFAPWGGTVGAREDFVWFDAFMDRMASDIGGSPGRSAKTEIHVLARAEGLVVWMSSTNDDGSTDTLEIVKLSRDPLPAAMFHVPPDYKEFSRPLSASEHPHIGPPPMDDGRVRRDRRSSGRVSGVVGLVLAFAIIIGLLIHAAFLHLAASVVIDESRFMQALVAAVIISGVLVVVELIGLPPVIQVAFGGFTVFAALKISYGASIGRTLALCVVSLVIVGAVAYLAHGCVPS